MQPKNNDQLLNYIHQIQNNPHFCILPFIHLHVGTIGDVKPCCMAKWQHPIQQNVIGKDLLNIWTGEEYRALRTKMLNGDPIQACGDCYALDKAGGGSDRETHTMQFATLDTEWQLDIDNGNTSGHPTWIDIRPGRLCNLKCRMCFSSVSSKISEEIYKNPSLIKITGDHGCNTGEWIDDPVLFKNLQDLIPDLTILKLAGGEPFFMPGVIKLLKWCVDSGNTHLTLDITTNGTRINGKVATWLSAFSAVQIHLSIDGVGSLNDYIRHGSKWDEVSKSYEYYLSRNMTANILATVQIYNAHYLPNIIRYWKKLGSKNYLIFNFVDAPSDLSIDLIPMEDKLKIASEIELLVDDISPVLKSKCRFNATIAKLRKDIDTASLDCLRQQWILRTDALDAIRDEKLELVNPELYKLYTAWKKKYQ